MDLGEATRLYQAAQAEVSLLTDENHAADVERLMQVLDQARREMEVAWLEHVASQ